MLLNISVVSGYNNLLELNVPLRPVRTASKNCDEVVVVAATRGIPEQ